MPEVQALIGKKCYFSDRPAGDYWTEKMVLLETRKTDWEYRYSSKGSRAFSFTKAVPQSTVTEVTMEEVCEKFGKPVKIIK